MNRRCTLCLSPVNGAVCPECGCLLTEPVEDVPMVSVPRSDLLLVLEALYPIPVAAEYRDAARRLRVATGIMVGDLVEAPR